MVEIVASGARLPESSRAGVRAPGLMRQLNTTVRWLGGGSEPAEAIAFFCECGLDTCFTPVWKTKAEFDTFVEVSARWILGEGHRISDSRV